MYQRVLPNTSSATAANAALEKKGARVDRKGDEPHGRISWPAINQRVGTDGHLIDVCTGTGKQKNLRAYLDRPALLGKDSRGGAMALLAATEMAALNLNPNR